MKLAGTKGPARARTGGKCGLSAAGRWYTGGMDRIPASTAAVAERLRDAFVRRDEVAFGALLDDNVRWGGDEETDRTCHNRSEVLAAYRDVVASGAAGRVTEVAELQIEGERVLMALPVKGARGALAREQGTVYQVFTVRDGLIVDIRGSTDRGDALALLRDKR